ncbi:MAG: regulatory protein RecX [Lachnospiraceae bacterium]|nr:regulatory protein RecX [Lachnospiraceae bacterium]
MLITDIKEHNQSKYKVYVDHEFAFVLYKGELHKYGIKKDAVLSEEMYREIIEQVLLKRAKLRAMNLLTKRPYTEAKLREKLCEGMYPPSCTDKAIAYVKSFGYLDDRAYAEDYISYHMESQSRRVMERKLLQKGIDAKVIQECMAKLDDGQISEREREQIRALFEKKYKGQIPQEASEKAKMLQFFLRKGYAMSNVKHALAEISLDDLYN